MSQEMNRLTIAYTLAISPAGRPIHEFQSIKELLEALRDAIKAYRSFYLTSRILHRHISEDNTIITYPEKAAGFTGILIEADLAKEVGSRPSGAQHRTGTMEFMAIEVLLGVSHTYRHYLESFFQLFLWLCARRGRKDCLPANSALTKWYPSIFDGIASARLGHMLKGTGFGFILRELPSGFCKVKPLCKAVRGILFPVRVVNYLQGPLTTQRFYMDLSSKHLMTP